MIIQRDGKRVRLWTRNGHDWSDKYPLITAAALRIRSTSFVLDGEAVLLGVDGISDFDGLHSRRHNDGVQFYAFDILVDAGDDLRKLPLHLRKNSLARLLARRLDGIFVSDYNRARSVPTSTDTPACSAWRASYRNTGIAPIARAGRRAG